MINKRQLLLIIFFFSGVAALIYEISWARKLELVFGTTAYAVATVLAVFFTGLAIGSYLFGKFADRIAADRTRTDKLLVLFASLELGIAVYAFLTPTLFKLIGSTQVSLAQSLGYGFTGFNLTTLFLSFIVLIIPSTLIGGTLPVLVKYFTLTQSSDHGQVGRNTGILYSVNTAGAVVGTILAGFVLVFYLGINGTIFAAAAMNVAVAITILLFILPAERDARVFTRPKKALDTKVLSSSKLTPKTYNLNPILLVFFLTGFAALALEVLWTRVLIMAIGTSVYSFSIILASFLLGIAIGSFLISRFIERVNPLFWLIGIFFALGGIVIATTAFLSSLPLTFFSLVKIFSPSSFVEMQLIGVAISFLILLFPTVLMGASFPLGVALYTSKRKHTGLRIGKLYSVNTLGGVAGSLVGGFILLPALGLQKSIIIAAAVYFFSACFLILLILKKKGLTAGCFIAGGFIVFLGFFFPWEKELINSGLYFVINYPEESTREIVQEYYREQELLYYKEGVVATVSVLNIGDTRYLNINGKANASISVDDMHTQLLLGHLPLLLHDDPKSVLVIGLGSGITLGAVEKHPVDTIDVVEIEPAVVEAARYFNDFNGRALDDSRVETIIGDGRNYLKVTGRKYDVISSETSNFWLSGSYSLFTKEFYELAKESLDEKGLLLQWLHTYQVDAESLRSGIATLQSVFPYVSVWSDITRNGDLLVVAGREPLHFNIENVRRRLDDDKVSQDLARVGIADIDDFLAKLFLGYEEVKQFSRGAKLNTDNLPSLWIKSPLSLYRGSEAVIENVTAMSQFRSEEMGRMFIFESEKQEIEFRKRESAWDLYNKAFLLSKEQKFEEAVDEYEEALALYPTHAGMKESLRSSYVFMVVKYEKEGDLERARYYVEKIKELSEK